MSSESVMATKNELSVQRRVVRTYTHTLMGRRRQLDGNPKKQEILAGYIRQLIELRDGKEWLGGERVTKEKLEQIKQKYQTIREAANKVHY